MKNKEVDIIGAGIGGLTLAIALNRKGITTRIFEQAAELKPTGAGIILAKNAMEIYKKLGLEKSIKKHGVNVDSANICRTDLSILSTSYFKEKKDTKSDGNIAIHRGKLQQILLEQINTNNLNLNHKLESIESNNLNTLLKFKNGIETKSNCLIASDGINSVVRNHLFPESKIRNAQQICWRGISEYRLPQKLQSQLYEAWGKESRFGFVQIDEESVYWYALKSFKSSVEELDLKQITNYFRAFHPITFEILDATCESHIHTAEITDLEPLKKWHHNHICLIGDAAHATTPNLGQGACQAIEDAYYLSEYLAKFESKIAFEKFQLKRQNKVNFIVDTSWKLGKIAHYKNPILIAFRNLLFKSMTLKMKTKQQERIFKLEEL